MGIHTTVLLCCSLLVAVTGCAGVGLGGRLGPLPSRLEYAYNQCKDGGGRECFERILGPADFAGATKNEGEIYMRWLSASRTRTAWSIHESNESASGPCKLEINLKGTEVTGWLFTGTCRDEILDRASAMMKDLPNGPPLPEIKLPSVKARYPQ